MRALDKHQTSMRDEHPMSHPQSIEMLASLMIFAHLSVSLRM